jgi:prepilin-type N-terminal cleavage/methylation domain-containing protein
MQDGVTLIELMIAMVISLLVLLALVSIFVNSSRSSSEMAKTNDLLENGRVSLQLLTEDLVHAGFWGGYLPRFDDLTTADIPVDAPTGIPNPCQAFSTWDAAYRKNILGIAVQSNNALPSGTGCLSPLVQRANTDVLVVRHADTCIPGVGNCDADAAGNLYFQYPQCTTDRKATAQGGTANGITLAASASISDNAYVGASIRTVTGPGAGQFRLISGYQGSTQIATVSPDWSIAPTSATVYAIEYVLGTSAYPLLKKDCTTINEKRRFISNIYYVTDIIQDGITIPTLVRSQLGLASGSIAHQAPTVLIDGVEMLRVVLGVDDVSETGATVDYTASVNWVDPATKTSPANRGDGTPDRFIRCTTAAACTVDQLTNVVAAKLYVLTRSREPTPGYTDTKTYCLGEPQGDGSCATADKFTPAANDHYKRHVFVTSVRINNLSARRETP